MKVLSIVCQKGGSAKTTTAINLAVEALRHGLEVVLIDLDPQVSASDWKDIRGDEDTRPVVAATPVPHLDRALKAAMGAGADLAIIDTAGRANETASAAARVADLVLIPLQPSLADLNTLDATLDIVRLAGGKPTRVLLARVRAGGTRYDTTVAWLADKGVEVCPVTLGERVIFQDAYAMGLGVSEAEPHGKAAEEVQNLYKYTSIILGLPTKGKGADEKAKRTSKRSA